MNLHFNDQGGITYATEQRIGEPEHRSDVLADVRMVVDGLQELCAKVRECWPGDIPDDLNALLKFQDFALAKIRAGTLKRFAEACAE